MRNSIRITIALAIITCIHQLTHSFPSQLPAVDFFAGMSHYAAFAPAKYAQEARWSLLKSLYAKAVAESNKPNHQRIPDHFHLICFSPNIPAHYHTLIHQLKTLHAGCRVNLWTEKEARNFPFVNKKAFLYAKTSDEKADVFRYEILNRHGGIYLDPHFQLLKPLTPLLTLNFFTGVAYSKNVQLYNGLIGCVAHHPIIKKCLEIKQTGSTTNYNAISQRSGIKHFTECFFSQIKSSPEKTVAFPVNFFYPIPPYEISVFGPYVNRTHLPEYSFAVYQWKRESLGNVTLWPQKPNRTIKPSSIIAQEKPFVIVTLTHNNESYCVENLKLTLEQDYSNFRIIIINDHSTDTTEAKIFNFLKNHPRAHLVTYIKTSKRKLGMANHLSAISLCNDNEIVVHYDGDDFFTGNYVLKRLNHEYQDPSTWMTWGSYTNMSNGTRGFSAPVQAKHRVRYGKWATSHVRTFYAWLFRKIQASDFKYKNGYLPCCCDLAVMFPLVELAGDHAHYISQILLKYNDLNRNNIFKTSFSLSVEIERHIRSIKPYKWLKNRNSPAEK